MDVTFYGLKSCDTCKKSLKALQQAGHAVIYIDVRADGVESDILAKFEIYFGKTLMNTRSTTWRNLSAEARMRPALELIAEHPTLMKRPVIVAGDAMFLGWGKDVQERFLKK